MYLDLSPGAVLKISKESISKPEGNKINSYEDEDEDEEKSIDTYEGEQIASFDNILVFNHEKLPDETSDPYIKGLQEWTALAEAVCVNSYTLAAVADGTLDTLQGFLSANQIIGTST